MRAIEALKHKKPVVRGHVGKKPVDEFAIDVFGEREMKEKLPSATFDSFAKSNSEGSPLDPNVADQIATAMKEWAMHRGATHFTHWFQPLTGLTAEKHDSFVSFTGPMYNRKVIMNFSGKQLIKGEPDASSFPSGGLRSTFEARGYTVWDMSSPAFLRRGANGSFLCVPTAFCSWGGHALDFKTPLLRSEFVLSKSVARLMNILGDKDVKGAVSENGVEQEFFLIDRDFYFSRPDLVHCGRTLQGAKPPKGQELEDHYFGNLDKRVLAFLQDAEYNLWRLGIPMTTRHNEVAPAQFEMAPIFENLPVACDHNMLMMEILREVAKEHEFACLLHEKPFAGVNGSGKHNNYSISTTTFSGLPGKNLTDPGNSPEDNAKFMVMVSALVRALNLHGDVLRVGVATTGNDHRLGANEAPPAIISMFLGDQLSRVVDELITDGTSTQASHISTKSQMVLGVNSLPSLPRDASDRNRTSSFAFTGNKFEFRAVGSSQSCAMPMLMLNTIVADSVNHVADLLEQELKSGASRTVSIQKVVANVLRENKGAIFNGNGYSEEWKREAVKRKLFNLPSSPEAFRELGSDKNKKLFGSLGILSDVELTSHQHVLYEQYVKALNVEAHSLADIAVTYILPVALEFKSRLYNFAASDDSGLQKAYFGKSNTLANDLITSIEALKKAVAHAETLREDHLHEKATFYYQEILNGHMKKVRSICDEIESIVDNKLWPLPKYSEMLFLK
jgi:glutamine synthetase